MEQKDYKEIAKIIKGEIDSIKKAKYLKQQEEVTISEISCLIKSLANYFEKENPLGYYKSGEGLRGFHKEQFLKDCGVE